MSDLFIGATKTIRDAVSSDDASNPTVGTGKAFQKFAYVEVEITIGGTTPSWDITPLLVNGAGDTYMEGVTETISGAGTYVRKIEVDGNSDVNFRVDNSSGTSPTITIKGRGVNK